MDGMRNEQARAGRTSSGRYKPPAVRKGVVARAVFVGAGLACTLLATAGAFLPVLPTTPFLLLAAACFARSSPKLHQRLLDNRVFGPYLVQWQHDRTVPRKGKRQAYWVICVAFGISIGVVDDNWLRALLVAIGAGLVSFILWLPDTEEGAASRPKSD